MSEYKGKGKEARERVPIFEGHEGPAKFLFFMDQFRAFLHHAELEGVLEKAGELNEEKKKNEAMIKSHLIACLGEKPLASVRGMTARDAWKALKRDYFTFGESDVFTIKQRIATKKWRAGVDNLISYRDEVNLDNAILTELRKGFSGRELIELTVQNLPMSTKPLCLHWLAKIAAAEEKHEEASTCSFNEFMSDLAANMRRLGIEIDGGGGGGGGGGAMAMYGGAQGEEKEHFDHHQHSRGRGRGQGPGPAQGGRGRGRSGGLVCYRCRQRGHPARLCTATWAEAEEAQSHAKIALGKHLTGIATNDKSWVADSGASRHLVAHEHLLLNATLYDPKHAPVVITANKQEIKATMHGDVNITATTTDGTPTTITLHDCMLVPHLGLNLLSTTRFVAEREDGAQFAQTKSGQALTLPGGAVIPLRLKAGIPMLEVHKEATTAATATVDESKPNKVRTAATTTMTAESVKQKGEEKGGKRNTESEASDKVNKGERTQFTMEGNESTKEKKYLGEEMGKGEERETKEMTTQHAALAETRPLTTQLLHDRLGHPGPQRLQQILAQHGDEPWLKEIKTLDDLNVCETCHVTKARRQPMNHETTDHSKREPGDLLVIDMVGPIKPSSIGGATVVLLIQDAHTNMAEAIPMRSKDEAPEALRQYALDQATQRAGFGIPVRKNKTILQHDNDSVFTGEAFKEMCKELGVQTRTSGTACPTRQGKAESAIYHLVQDATALMHRTACPPGYWALAVKHMAWLRNRMPTRALGGKSPMEARTGRKETDLHRARLFGATAYVHIEKPDRRGKLGDKAIKGRYVGESPHGAGHLILCNNSLRTAVHVTFDETGQYTQDDNTNYDITIAEAPADVGESQQQTEQREDSTQAEDDSAASVTSSNATTRSANIFHQIHEILGSYPTAFAVMEPVNDAPLTVPEAMDREDWLEFKAAANKEMEGHEANGTWVKIDISEVPPGEQILNSRMSLKIKLASTGQIIKYKGRLLVIGCAERREEGESNYSPVASITTVRIILTIAAARGLELATSDISQAYTQAPPRKDTYVRAPKNVDGYDHTTDVLFLKKNLYGLRSGAIQFYLTMSKFLISINFTRTHSDPCLFFRYDKEHEHPLFVTVFVDDLLQAGTNKQIKAFQAQLQRRFDITSAQPAIEYLGFAIKRHDDGSIGIRQEHKIAMAVRLMDIKDTATTPMKPGTQLAKDEGDRLSEIDGERYRTCVGLLLHISGVYRADIAFAVNQLCRYNSDPRSTHEDALKHLVRYLNHTKDDELTLGKNKDTTITAWADADLAGCKDTGRSTSGAIIKMCGGTVFYSSKRQNTVASSTTHSELIAISSLAKTVMHLRQMLEEIGINQPATTLYTDNEAAKNVANAIGPTSKTKHVAREDFYIQERVQQKDIVVKHIMGRNMPSDGLTKSVPRIAINKMREETLG